MRAIILAAGLGSRLRPLTNNKPKALVEVDGVPMVERQIQFLQEKEIKEIVILTGYLREKFEYLVPKYNVELVHNDKYDLYNNIYSLYLVKDFLPGAYVIEGDIYLNRNVFDETINTSTYFCPLRKQFTSEWILQHTPNGKVTGISVGDGENDYILSGISYWSEKDGEFIKEKLAEAIAARDFKNLYWDDIPRENFEQLNVSLRPLQHTDLFEIDSVEDLKMVEETIKSL
ncbi:CTP--phosphocholine cytidylyltransferase [Bacillus sp. MKU004]|nr:CTP--phosphocholine cytidylyltransferase [Bacillus sp. MKU004]